MFGIGMGPSSQENQQYNQLGASSNFSTGLGEQNLTASSKFMNGILSGDSSKISQALAPQIGAAKASANSQRLADTTQGNRSGGTAASTAAASDKAHSDITNLIGGATSGAASGLASSGGSLLSSGMSGNQAAFGEANTLQQQHEAKMNDIFKSVAAVAAAPFTGGASLSLLAGGGGAPSAGGGTNVSIGGGGSGQSNPFGNMSVPSWLGGGGGGAVPTAPMSMFGG